MKILALSATAALFSLGTSMAAEKPLVVTTSPVLTEITQAVGGNMVRIDPLVKAGENPHEYRPTPSDLADLGSANLILASGKHMEPYIDKLDAGPAHGTILEVGDHIPSLEMKAEEDGHGHAHSHGDAAHDEAVEDPHWWHSVPNVIKATELVRDALEKLEPAHAAEFQANAAARIERLQALDADLREKISELPRDQRELVTSHDAFQYFAKEYGFKIFAIEGINPEQEPSAKEISELIHTIESQHVKAIFLEDTLNPKVSTELTRETGARIGGTLTADGLGTGDTSTYEGMMTHNVTTIVDALK